MYKAKFMASVTMTVTFTFPVYVEYSGKVDPRRMVMRRVLAFGDQFARDAMSVHYPHLTEVEQKEANAASKVTEIRLLDERV